jgi:multiple sugar transport system substrate-binding protein
MSHTHIRRRQLLKNAGLAGAGLALAAVAGARPLTAAPASAPTPRRTRALKLQLISHFVVGYDDWIRTLAVDWGRGRGVQVTVDFVTNLDVAARGAAEVAAQRGHDIVQWDLAVSSPFLWKNHMINLTGLVHDIETRSGKFSSVGVQAGFDSTAGVWFSLPIFYMAFPALYRKDLWDQVGGAPDTWERVLEGGRRLKAMGHPVGMPISRGSDANVNWRGLIWAFGGAVQDKDQQVAINSKEVVEAVRFARALYKETMTDEVLSWDDTGNNRFLASGRGSLIFNPISAYRSIQASDRALADRIFVARPPQGPRGRWMGVTAHTWSIWQFAENQANAMDFMRYFVSQYRASFETSGGYNMPMNPGWLPQPTPLLSNDPTSNPPDKLSVLQTAPEWCAAFEYPGPNSPAMGEVVSTFIVPDMIAQAATDRMSPEEAVAWAEAQVRRIVSKWRS